MTSSLAVSVPSVVRSHFVSMEPEKQVVLMEFGHSQHHSAAWVSEKIFEEKLEIAVVPKSADL